MSFKSFLSVYLPNLVDQAKLIIVATYNNLDTCKQNAEFNFGDKKVTVLCGGADYANVEFVANPRAGATKDVGMERVSSGLSEVFPNSLIILYAGESKLDQTTSLAYRLNSLGAKVALVSCGCNQQVFSFVRHERGIYYVVPTHGQCNGGRLDFSVLLEVIKVQALGNPSTLKS